MGLIIKNFDIGYKSLIFNVSTLGAFATIDILQNTTNILNWNITDSGNGLLAITPSGAPFIDITQISVNVTPITNEAYNYTINIVRQLGINPELILYCCENNLLSNPNEIGFLYSTVEIKFFNL